MKAIMFYCIQRNMLIIICTRVVTCMLLKQWGVGEADYFVLIEALQCTGTYCTNHRHHTEPLLDKKLKRIIII